MCLLQYTVQTYHFVSGVVTGAGRVILLVDTNPTKESKISTLISTGIAETYVLELPIYKKKTD